MEWIGISQLITSATKLALNIKQVAEQPRPDASNKLMEKKRWLQCTVKNETQFAIMLEKTYFDSGRYHEAPGPIPAFSQMTFSCCEGDSTVLTGATGGTLFSMVLDDNHTYPFAIGWTNPKFGYVKAGVVTKSMDGGDLTPEDGYNAATEVGASLDSPRFKGKEKDGNEVTIRFHISAAPGQKPMFVITQIITNQEAPPV